MKTLSCILIVLLLSQYGQGTTAQEANSENSLGDANAIVPVVVVIDDKNGVDITGEGKIFSIDYLLYTIINYMYNIL